MNHINRIGRQTLIAMGVMAVLLAIVALAGCMETTQPGQGEAFLPKEQIAAKDDARCQSYGAKPGSPEYINCRGQQDQMRTQWRSSN
jgi:hypothetical protein